MEKINLKKLVAVGLTLAGVAFTPNLHADVELLLSGGSASSGVIFDRATNLFGGSFSATYGTSSSTTRTYVGTIPGYAGLGNVTLDINLNVGAVGGLNDISVGNPEPVAGPSGNFTPTVIDSSASPDVTGVDPSQFTALPTYIVPYVFIKNNNSTDTAGITNLTQRQAALLESAGATIPAAFFGGGSTNVIHFVGRNKDSAVRTEIDLNIQANGFQTYTTNGLGQIVQDTTGLDAEGNVDPGQTSGSAEQVIVKSITNSIGEVAVQNDSGTTPLAYEGVAYSTNNVINGSYPLWNPENYYYLNSLPTSNPNQLTVINLFYQSVTNSTFYTNPNFQNKFIPTPWLNVTRSGDGGPISPNAGYP